MVKIKDIQYQYVIYYAGEGYLCKYRTLIYNPYTGHKLSDGIFTDTKWGARRKVRKWIKKRRRRIDAGAIEERVIST